MLCDEIFGRQNFVSTVLWQKIHSLKNDAKYLSSNHDFVLVYAKNKDLISFNLLPRTEEMNNRYKNPDNDPRGAWQSGDLVANEERANGYYDVVSPATGKVFNVQQGKHWVYSQENMEQMIADNRIWFGSDGNAFPRKKRFLSEVMDGRKGDTWWTSAEVGHNQEAKREIIKLFGTTHVFATPKPERLIERILTLGSNEGDLVLDSFLGSGTTAAVAHKMGRRYIGIELGEHCYTHCIPRLQKVVDGEQGGISKAQGWQGGGGFKFYELAPTLIVKDKHGQPVFSEQYNPQMLVAAVAKLNGFKSAKATTQALLNNLIEQNSQITTRTSHNQTALTGIKEASAKLALMTERYKWLKALSDTANGDVSGKEKIKLETYIQTAYFDRIVSRANIRLMQMSCAQYELKRRGAGGLKSQSGLDLNVIDHYNGTERDVKTLSGGESFIASLSLALGLSDEIQSYAGGIRLDSMFIDEGFGSLDETTLSQAMQALLSIAQSNRLVGIISHVGELREKIDRQILVTKERVGGSKASIVLS